MTRASGFAIQEGLGLITCSAEDLIVFKAFAGREKDWRAQGAPEATHRLRALLDRARS